MTTKTYTASTTLNYTPRKSRLIIDLLRGMALDSALLQLSFMNKEKTKPFFNLLKSAAFNLKLAEGDYENYYISYIVAEEAQKFYRMQPRARGSASKIRRRHSRIKVLLTKYDIDEKLESQNSIEKINNQAHNHEDHSGHNH
jgi:large subunit ribosomal protein L22